MRIILLLVWCSLTLSFCTHNFNLHKSNCPPLVIRKFTDKNYMSYMSSVNSPITVKIKNNVDDSPIVANSWSKRLEKVPNYLTVARVAHVPAIMASFSLDMVNSYHCVLTDVSKSAVNLSETHFVLVVHHRQCD